MSELTYKPEIIIQLEKVLKKKRVIVFACNRQEYLRLFDKALIERNSADVELWHSMDGQPDDIVLKVKAPQQIEEILELYRLYDFSDRVMVINEADQFGSLFNYVKNELLSDEEMVEACLSGL